MSQIRTRFAPSPTGYLHVGGARTALFNYLFAKSNGGQFVLRIEDTDRERSTPEATKQVIDSMRWLGLDWDEGPEVEGPYSPYFQAQRLDIYQRHLDQLLEQGKAYRCFCTSEELVEKKKRQEAMGLAPIYDGKCRNLSDKELKEKMATQTNFTYRFKVNAQELIFEDMVRGKVKFHSKLIGDFIIKKGDGFPTYNFAVVVDDALMNITHILRGDDHISNTPRQLMIYEALGFDIPKFSHISMILGSDKEKLSKRHGATSVLEYKKAGYLVEPFLNFLALLGWSPTDGIEIISKKTLEQAFIQAKFSKSPAIFNLEKLDFLNGHYIRNMDINKVCELALPHIQNGPYKDHDIVKEQGERLKKIIEAIKDYCKKLPEINQYLDVFFKDSFEIPTDLKHYFRAEHSLKLIDLAIEEFSNLDKDGIKSQDFKDLMKLAKLKLNLGGKQFFKPMRIAISGTDQGLELDLLFNILPKQSIIKRLKHTRGQFA